MKKAGYILPVIAVLVIDYYVWYVPRDAGVGLIIVARVRNKHFRK